MRHILLEQHWQNNQSILNTVIDWFPLIVGLIALGTSLYIASHNFKKEKYFHLQKTVEEITSTLFHIDIHLNNVINQAKAYLQAKEENIPVSKHIDIVGENYLKEFNNQLIKAVTYIQLYFPNIHNEWDTLQEVVNESTNALADIINDFNNSDKHKIVKKIEKINQQLSRLWMGFQQNMVNSVVRESKKEEPQICIFGRF